MQHRQLISIVLFALALSGQAQTNTPSTRQLTLRDCITLSLQNNLALKSKKISSKIATFQVQAARGAWDPVLSLRANRSFEQAPSDYNPSRISNEDVPTWPYGNPAGELVDTTNVVNRARNPYELKTDTFGAGLNGKLPLSGTLYGFDTFIERRDSRTFPYSGQWFKIKNLVPTATGYDYGELPPLYAYEVATNNYRTVAEFTLTQPLLKNFWIDADRTAILVAKENLKISREALRADIITNVSGVQMAYYDLIACKEMVKSQQEALEAAKLLFSDTKRKVDVGELPKLMESQAEMLVATVESDLLAAEQRYVESESAMKNLITDRYADWADIRIEPSETLLVITERPKLAETWEMALKYRPEILEERAILERQGILVRFTSNQRLPSLDLVGSFGWTGINNSLSGISQEYSEGANNFYGVGIVLSMPLSNIRARNNHNAAVAAREQAALHFKSTQQSIMVEVDTALSNVEFSLKRVSKTETARKYAAQALQAEQLKLQNNTGTPYLVQLAQRDLLTARAAEIQAKSDYNKARTTLDKAQGITMERNTISLNFR